MSTYSLHCKWLSEIFILNSWQRVEVSLWGKYFTAYVQKKVCAVNSTPSQGWSLSHITRCSHCLIIKHIPSWSSCSFYFSEVPGNATRSYLSSLLKEVPVCNGNWTAHLKSPRANQSQTHKSGCHVDLLFNIMLFFCPDKTQPHATAICNSKHTDGNLDM